MTRPARLVFSTVMTGNGYRRYPSSQESGRSLWLRQPASSSTNMLVVHRVLPVTIGDGIYSNLFDYVHHHYGLESPDFQPWRRQKNCILRSGGPHKARPFFGTRASHDDAWGGKILDLGLLGGAISVRTRDSTFVVVAVPRKRSSTENPHVLIVHK